MLTTFFARIWLEAAVVGVVCVFFLGLFIAAGIREILKQGKNS